ncbi:MAG: sigma-54-dependent Fis family transcriptional regulator [Polyangiaceae bacterium]|nr:sigma-54-dependent Fis family transcriptional regulator [Polyangiaceae bacterium]
MDELDWKEFAVVVVDDEEDNLDAFRFAFRKSFQLHYALGGQAGLEILDRVDAAVIVSDQRMPQMSGIEFLRRAKEKRPDAVGILLTAYADIPVLVEAINSGAVERYVQKPWDSKELAAILRQGIRSFATVRENRRLREQLAHYAGYLEREQRDPIDYGEIAGESPSMQAVAKRIEEVAASRSPVLIEGEPGCEQEVVARAIHVGSAREDRPFVRVTCAAFRGDALERELFGWRKAAFTGALEDRAGRFELADGGTLFLDAPETPSASLQARLLRILDEGTAERVGSTEPHRLDVRLILSLPNGLDRSWDRGAVLPELLSKLEVFPIQLLPLRDRQEDVVPLAEHFLRKYGRRNARAATSLSDDSKAVLSKYDFPGNARELENVIERAAILARGDVIEPTHLAFQTRPTAARASIPGVAEATASPASTGSEAQGDLTARLEDIERRELLSALERCAGNKAEVARTLGIQRTTLYYRLKRLGIEA